MRSMGEGYEINRVRVPNAENERVLAYPSPPFGRVPSPADAGEELASRAYSKLGCGAEAETSASPATSAPTARTE